MNFFLNFIEKQLAFFFYLDYLFSFFFCELLLYLYAFMLTLKLNNNNLKLEAAFYLQTIKTFQNYVYLLYYKMTFFAALFNK